MSWQTTSNKEKKIFPFQARGLNKNLSAEVHFKPRDLDGDITIKFNAKGLSYDEDEQLEAIEVMSEACKESYFKLLGKMQSQYKEKNGIAPTQEDLFGGAAPKQAKEDTEGEGDSVTVSAV